MNDIRYQYIPKGIIRAWKNDEGTLCSCNSESCETVDVTKEEVFIEDLAAGRKTNVPDIFDNEEYRSLFAKLRRGDDSLSDDEKYLVKELLALQFYCNPYSYGRAFELYGYDEKHMKTALEANMKKRTTDDLLLQYLKAMFYVVYILDLEVVLVSAPADASFVLASYPMIISDPAFGPDELLSQRPYTANGTIIFMPVSPSYAVAAYDSFVYKAIKRGGKLMLTEEDVDEYNRAVFPTGERVVYNPALTDVSLFKAADPDGWTASFSYSPSVFGIRARYTEVQEIQDRVYCGLLEMSDRKYIREDGALVISGDEQIRRYDKARKMLDDMKKS